MEVRPERYLKMQLHLSDHGGGRLATGHHIAEALPATAGGTMFVAARRERDRMGRHGTRENNQIAWMVEKAGPQSFIELKRRRKK